MLHSKFKANNFLWNHTEYLELHILVKVLVIEAPWNRLLKTLFACFLLKRQMLAVLLLSLTVHCTAQHPTLRKGTDQLKHQVLQLAADMKNTIFRCFAITI